MKLVYALPILIIVLISGCTQQQPITEISIPGHPIYAFSNDVRESLQVRTSDPDGIRRLVLISRNITVVFNGSDENDNGIFQVAAFDTVTRLQTYFVYEGVILSVASSYYIGDQWFSIVNGTSMPVAMPEFTGPVIWLKGPATGANETSVTLDKNIIIVQGITQKGVTLAGDRLSLVVLGVERV